MCNDVGMLPIRPCVLRHYGKQSRLAPQLLSMPRRVGTADLKLMWKAQVARSRGRTAKAISGFRDLWDLGLRVKGVIVFPRFP